MRMRTSMALAGALALVGPAATAQAQDPGQTITVNIPSYLELTLSQPSTAFGTFKAAKTYTAAFEAKTTSTVPAELSVQDGDVQTGAKVGRLASGSKTLPAPLEAKTGGASFASLDSPVATPLSRWTDARSNVTAKVDLRQKVAAKTSGNYRKLLLVTLSTETP